MNFNEAIKKFDPVIGFEIHVELNTKTKMFCGCPNSFSVEPNINICPVCLGLPGALPVVNKKAVESSIKIGLALNCDIAKETYFSRKQYFYPDIPKNFQTSQHKNPIAENGSVDIELENKKLLTIKIERAHMEEDAGKLIHQGNHDGSIQNSTSTLIDYNRAGIPLVEIVTCPIEVDNTYATYAPQIAKTYVATICEIVKSINVSEAKMELGHIRCDANISIKPKNSRKLGTRTETKNINSLRSIEKVVKYEIQRQAYILNNGGNVLQETRHWNDSLGVTYCTRKKSDLNDYRYFPEPDLGLIAPKLSWVQELKRSLPELPMKRRRRLALKWGYSDSEFRDIENSGLLDKIEKTISIGVNPINARKWWMGEIARHASIKKIPPSSIKISEQDILELDILTKNRNINDSLARQVIEHVVSGEGSPFQVVKKHKLEIISNDDDLSRLIDGLLQDNISIASKITSGKIKAIDVIVGKVMQSTKGKADAKKVREMIIKKKLIKD